MSPNPQVVRRSLPGWLVITLALLVGSTAGSVLAQERFNVLEALSIDASGTLELFGKNDPEGPEEPIPYRQVLGEALANSGAPQFSLDSDFSGFTRQMLAGKRMEDLFYSGPGQLSPFGKAALQALKVPAPEGDNVAYVNLTGNRVRQVLAEPLEAETFYLLEVEVGDRLDDPFAGYRVQLLAGGVLLAESSSPTPPNDGFVTSTVEYLASPTDPLIGQPLEIKLLSLGVQANFDDVRLKAIPTGIIFMDGFESGDTSLWSEVIE